jgi:hypothetical protein
LGAILLAGGGGLKKHVPLRGGIVEYLIISIKLSGEEDDRFNDPLDYYLKVFRANPSGIRHNPFLANVCIKCGHQNLISPPGTKYCENCGASWLTDHCWNCRSPVDSRDQRTPRCRKCKRCICVNCGRCYCDANFLFTKKDEDNQ